MAKHDGWMDENDPLVAKGLEQRRKVLGDEYVDKSLALAEANPLKKILQDSVTKLAWGGVWGREGLDAKFRSLVTLSVLLSLGRNDEFVLHVRGALRNGWTPEELAEAIIHIGCYAGWPASVQGFRLVEHILSEAQTAKD